MITAYFFTQSVSLALVRAREEAERLGYQYIGPEHVVLGILATARGPAAAALASIDRPAVAEDIAKRIGTGSAQPLEGGDLPYTAGAKKILEFAMAEAMKLGHTEVDMDHLLLGALREPRSIGVQALATAGLSLEAARAIILQERGRTSQ